MVDETTATAIPGPEGPASIIETDYTVGQDNIRNRVGPLVFDIHNPVFLISGLVIVAFVIITLRCRTRRTPSSSARATG
jgi:betaine/carnitine transporter, BCCT family